MWITPRRKVPVVSTTARLRRARPSESTTPPTRPRSEEHTSELQSRQYLVCRLLLEKQHLFLPPGLQLRFVNAAPPHRFSSPPQHADQLRVLPPSKTLLPHLCHRLSSHTQLSLIYPH